MRNKALHAMQSELVYCLFFHQNTRAVSAHPAMNTPINCADVDPR